MDFFLFDYNIRDLSPLLFGIVLKLDICYLSTVATGVTATVNTYLETEERIYSKATEFLFANLEKYVRQKIKRYLYTSSVE